MYFLFVPSAFGVSVCVPVSVPMSLSLHSCLSFSPLSLSFRVLSFLYCCIALYCLFLSCILSFVVVFLLCLGVFLFLRLCPSLYFTLSAYLCL